MMRRGSEIPPRSRFRLPVNAGLIGEQEKTNPLCSAVLKVPHRANIAFSAYPIHRLKTQLEGIDLLDGAIRPFGLDSPVITLAQHHAKKGLSRHHANHARTRWPGAPK